MLNSELARKQRLSIKYSKELASSQETCQFIIKVSLETLLEVGYKSALKPIQNSPFKSKRVLLINNVEVVALMHMVSVLRDKPMVIEPNDWVLKQQQSLLVAKGGGYLNNKIIDSHFFLSTEANVVTDKMI
jgi:hypothetical protein